MKWLERLRGLIRFARVRSEIRPKLIGAVGAILILLAGMGWIGLEVVSRLNMNTQQIIGLQKKIAAYSQVQHDATSGLYNVTAALLSADEATLEAALRQLYQFGYDLDRLEYVARDEVALANAVRAEHRLFENVVSEAVAMLRAGQTDDARHLSETKIHAAAEQLERLTNEMVNSAEARMLDGIEDSERAYDISRWIVVGFVFASAALALILGHAVSWLMVGPVVDRLLHAILPGPVVRELIASNRVVPKRYEGVAILFGDIQGFTQYCDQRPPEEVVANLQLLIERFEVSVAKHGLEKIKTIGDAVMATGNLVVPHGDPVMACLLLAGDLARAAADNPARWKVHVGIHIGPVVAGVLGHSKFAFDLWGDTVNVAARLVNLGGTAIHLSGDAWIHVSDRCVAEALGEVALRGKAAVSVYRCEYPASEAQVGAGRARGR